jgi:hypothetical protein
MQYKLSAGPLLDGQGRLVESGWSTRLVREYERAAIRAPWHRIKEWDYYCVLNERFGVSFTVADNSYMGLLALAWIDLESRSAINHSVTIPLTRGRLGMPASSGSGDLLVDHKGCSIAVCHLDGGRQLTVNCPGFWEGKGLQGELFLKDNTADSMVIATPFEGAPRAFYYNQKINHLAAEGHLTMAGQSYDFNVPGSFGMLDWGRGVWTWNNAWYWSSASGMHEGRTFGFNLGYGFGDTRMATENMLFYAGAAHKLDQVSFHIPGSGYTDQAWQLTSNDERLTLIFEPVVDRSSRVDVWLLRSIQHQVFGFFSGTAVLDDGSVLTISKLPGFAEQVENRW